MAGKVCLSEDMLDVCDQGGWDPTLPGVIMVGRTVG